MKTILKKVNKDKDLSTVLCAWDRGSRIEYVTWTHNATDNSFNSGHYHKTLTSALEDFETRTSTVQTDLFNIDALIHDELGNVIDQELEVWNAQKVDLWFKDLNNDIDNNVLYQFKEVN